MRQPLFCYGGPSGDRTLDTLIKSLHGREIEMAQPCDLLTHIIRRKP